ncbi:hypothetical protein RFI_30404 [Reticulomyxa filosa]|uniref:Uncharacterized protein n=1 Tax=Reticulomyxa filosa TaxID=46433 RepID=X6M070_RETFI|nr:hypothetical protein RFI_30404 [Reticulomyxa filosa]|eukprot:ETO06991.1 hypothetical protein RFI_30404 [Reticulomyxa filosa]
MFFSFKLDIFSRARCRRPFVDVVNRALTNYRSNPNKYHIPKLNSEFMNPRHSITAFSTKQSNIKKKDFQLFKLNVESTKLLETACQILGVTLQSTLSVAGILASFYLAKHDISSPINVRVQIPFQISRHVQPPANEEDCVCGTTALIYEVSLSLGYTKKKNFFFFFFEGSRLILKKMENN